MEQTDWNRLSYAEKNRQLYFQQKRLLDTFLSHHAISKEQYNKSLGDLTVKMGIGNDILNGHAERITDEADLKSDE